MKNLERLTAALADRYHIERELGQGGMATVYLATDLKHRRKVAIKVLRPELAASLGPDRFSREIEVAARLQHPHILGVLDSGNADGFFYYVMPFVEGETLRDRLARTGELPVADAVRLLSEVAEALAVAHRAGVVHRDIKPENVLLSGRHAMVMDFGVAKAVTEATDDHQLTSTGVALGTPAYMAPEQASADPHMDGRVDIYALGVMGYEMLAGHTPFPGLNPQQTLAAHVTQVPVPVGQQRAGLAPALDAAIMRCLAKRPADRFQSADELAAALEPLAGSSGGVTPTHTQPMSATAPARARRPRAFLVAGVALVGAAIALFAWKPWARAGSTPLDANLVAVMPFRVAGADPGLQYLRQGMVDLLQAKLTGQGGPRAADTRSVLAAVRDAGGTDSNDLDGNAINRVALRLGAGRVLQGSIVGPPDHLVVTASLVEVPRGATVAQASVEGPRDSLFVLVDQLTAKLLALGAGASSNQLSSLTTTSLDALRAYLDGVAAYRRGAFQVATPLLERAVGLDSTFALALSALIESHGWHSATLDMNRVQRLAWEHRDRLNPQDQLFLSLRLGSHYPRSTPWDVQIADAENAVQKVPESAEAWYYLGDALFHFGPVSDVSNPEVRARRAFEQAFAQDSMYATAITHLAALTFALGDTAAQRLWTRRMAALDSAAEGMATARWDLAAATGDAATISALLQATGSMSSERVRGIAFFSPLDSTTIAHQDELLAAAGRSAATRPERRELTFNRAMALWNRGRPAEAARWIDSLAAVDPGLGAIQSLLGFVAYGGERPDPSTLSADQVDYLRFHEGDMAAGKRALAVFRERAAGDTLRGGWARIAALTEAGLAVQASDPAAGRLVDRADSLWRGQSGNASWSSITLARLFEAQGRTDRALRAVRRRWMPLNQPQPVGLAESYRLEGQLAARVGDRDAAMRAYRNYLKLRFDPEPSKVPQRDSVRAELAAIANVEGVAR